MPAWITGPMCSREGCNRPPYEGGECFAHWAEARSVGRSPELVVESESLRACRAIWNASEAA